MTAWEERFRAARISLPEWADDVPDRCLTISNASGVFEAWTWEVSTGDLRQATSRPNGTVDAQLSRDGEHVWFFDDTDGDEFGTWRLQPFAGGPSEPALDIPPAYDVGLSFGPGGLVAVGSTNAEGSVIRVGTPGEPLTEIYRHSEDASLGALSHDGGIVVVAHSEHGDSRHPALRAYRVADGSVVNELWDGPGLGLQASEFAPVTGDTRLLVSHERRGRPELLIWDVATGAVSELNVDVPGEINADWYVDGRALLVGVDHEARSRLFRYDLATSTLSALDTPRGTVSGAAARPDGTVWIAWTSAESSSVIRSLPSGEVLLTPPGAGTVPPSVPLEDVWVEGPGGRIHALVSLPPGDRPPGSPPHPAIFHVHGGPEAHDRDRFDPSVAAWVDHGYAVVQVNYRGSSGYGSAWREAIVGRVGVTELEDLAAVRAHLVEAGVIDGARVVLEGGSWGGYLTLLGLGRQPELWAAGLAIVPVGDYVTAFAEEMEGLQAYDRALFGGTPEELPEAYRVSSPITYVDSVVAPIYIAVGENDPRCPAGQVDNYVAELAGLGRDHEVYRFDAGHGSLVTEERINQMRRELTVALRWVPTGVTAA